MQSHLSFHGVVVFAQRRDAVATHLVRRRKRMQDDQIALHAVLVPAGFSRGVCDL